MGRTKQIYEQHYRQTWLKIQRERQTVLEQREAKLDMERMLFKAKQRQFELEVRYGIEPEHRSREFEAKHPRNKDGTFAVKDLTDSAKSSTINISKSEADKVRDLINSQFYMYSGKKHGFISSYDLNARYEFDIVDFDNYIITKKKLL